MDRNKKYEWDQVPNSLKSCHSAKIDYYTNKTHALIESINKLLDKNQVLMF